MTGAQHLRRLRVALFLYLFGVCAYFQPSTTWSPVSRFALTRALVEQQSLEITPFASSTGDRARVGDRFYTDKAPVPSLLAVPAYAVVHAVDRLRKRLPAFQAVGTDERPAQRLITSPAFRRGLAACSVSTAAIAGAALGLVAHALLRRRHDERSSATAAVATVLATPLFPYATSFFGHTIAAAFLLGAFALVDPLRPAVSPRERALSGALLVLAGATEYIVALPALLLGAWSLWACSRDQRLRAAAALAAGALGPAVVVAGYHTACFGAPWRTGYAFVVHPAFSVGQATGFFGITSPRLEPLVELLFGPSRGLFYIAPLCLLAVASLWPAYRTRRDPAALIAGAVFSALLLLNAGYFQWNGGWATGPRHLVPALGFLTFGIGYAFASPRLRSLAAALAGISGTILLLTTAVALEAPPDQNAITEYLLPAVRGGRIARLGSSNLGLLAGLGPWASLVPVVLWIGVGLAFILRDARRFDATR